MGRIKSALTGFNFFFAIANNLKKIAIAAAPYMAASGIAMGVSNNLAMRNDRVIEARQEQAIQQIADSGADTQADLEALEMRIAENIAEETRKQAESLRATAEQLDGELRQTALNAADSLDLEADRLDGDVEVTNDSLQDSVDTINTTIEETQTALTEADNTLELAFIDLDAQRQSEIDALEVQNEALPPIGSIAWVVDPALIDANHYVNCDGADINGNILPNVNADGLFVRGGIFDGLSNTDTTKPNGLAGTFFDDTSNPANVNITYYSAVATSGTGANNGLTGSTDSVTFTGDAETAPVNLRLFCVIRHN